MKKKCFTIETRLEKETTLFEYLEEDIRKQNQIFRVVWKLIQEKKFTQSKLNTYLQITYQIDKRTANTLIQTARGRLKALKELKDLERSNLTTKMVTIERQIGKLQEELQELKPKVTANQATKKQLEKYRKQKQAIWQKKQRLNRMRQQWKRYEEQEKKTYLAICWGGKRLFKEQYYLHENGFLSHEGWLHTYQKKRDGQINFIGAVEEPKGNQNCQLNYDEEQDSFSLRVRKDLEFMKNEKDKFFVIFGLQFQHHRKKLIQTIQNASTPFTFRFLRRGRKWYVQVIFTWMIEEEDGIYKTDFGMIGLDFNDGFISWSETDYYGNLVGQEHFSLKYHGTGNKAESELQEIVAKIVKLAKEKEKPIGIEELNFNKTKARMVKSYQKSHKKYQKMLHAFDYSRYKKRMENA